jgi:hypothetical protein
VGGRTWSEKSFFIQDGQGVDEEQYCFYKRSNCETHLLRLTNVTNATEARRAASLPRFSVRVELTWPFYEADLQGRSKKAHHNVLHTQTEGFAVPRRRGIQCWRCGDSPILVLCVLMFCLSALKEVQTLVSWLEDTVIRFYKIEDRKPLRTFNSEWTKHFTTVFLCDTPRFCLT